MVVASLLVLACLAGARADLVLCTGADGHVKIEQAVHGACSAPDSIPVASGLGMVAAGHCGPCVDVPLESPPAVGTCHSRVLSHEFVLPVATLQSPPDFWIDVSAPARVTCPSPSYTPGGRILRI